MYNIAFKARLAIADRDALGCIDKTSSAELSEAINSMFRWYKNAQVCYAYLEDIEAHAMEDSNVPQRKASAVIDTPLETARWFTRGWTLQEMIAPTQLVFYASDWIFLGTKETLLDELINITKVDRRGLTDFRPEYFSVAQRMSWAANRRTVRTEDIAYSLMLVHYNTLILCEQMANIQLAI
jgi:hypothetical protein